MFFVGCQKNVGLIKDILKTLNRGIAGKSKDKPIMVFDFLTKIFTGKFNRTMKTVNFF